MPAKLYHAGFAAGELGRELAGRSDVDRYQIAAKRIENYEVTPVGSVRRRPGTVFLAEAKNASLAVRLERFEFNVEQAYCLEIGDFYIRFYRSRARIESGGSPVEVATPYAAAELEDLQVVQSADVMYFAHPSHFPHRLIRFSDTSWSFTPLPVFPLPLAPLLLSPAWSFTPSATTGLVFLTAPARWLEGDVGRTVTAGAAEAIITEVIPNPMPGVEYPADRVRAQVISPFPSTATVTSWQLSATPGPGVMQLRVSFDTDNVMGAGVSLRVENTTLPPIIFANVPQSNNLVLSGDFTSLTGWSDQSGRVLVSGTGEGDNQPELVDNTKNFVRAGAQVGHRVLNLTQNNEGLVGVIRSINGVSNANSVIDLIPLLAPSGSGDWNSGDAYEIRETGSITHDTAAGHVEIRGGLNGRGAIAQQSNAGGPNDRFLIEVDVRKQPVIIQVASNAPPKFGNAGSDVVDETTLEVGAKRRVIFKAKGNAGHYIQFSNTQDTDTVIDHVVVFPLTRQAWRAEDVGALVRVGGGLIEILSLTSVNQVEGRIRHPLSGEMNDDDEHVSPSGLWEVGQAAWSASQGYPGAVSLHQTRLWFGGTNEQPLTLWASQTGDFHNFNLGPEDSDALELELSSNELQAIEWMEPLGDLLIGTRAGESLIQGGPAGIVPSNAFQSPQTSIGSAGERPIRHDNLLYLLDRGRRFAWEVTTDSDTGLLAGRNIMRLAPEIAETGILQWDAQSWPHTAIWAVRDDGVLVSLTLDLSENIRAWHRHTTQGAFLSLQVVPRDDATDGQLEDVYVAVRRQTASGEQTFVEVMRRHLRTATEVREPLTLDCATRAGSPAGPVTLSQVTGLAALEGDALDIVERRAFTRADGREGEVWTHHGNAVVSGGILTLPQAMAAVDVGFLYVPVLKLLRPELNLRDGSTQFRLQRVQRVDLRAIDTVGFLTVNEEELPVRLPESEMDTGFQPADGDLQTRSLAGWDQDGFVTVSQPLPLPSHLLSVGVLAQFEEVD